VDGAVAALGTSLAFIPIAIFFRILIAWTYNRTGFSVLLAAVVHASWNSAATVLYPIAGPAAELLAIGTFVLLAIVVAVWSRGTLGYRPSRLQEGPLR
jgi:membrane protease YdiL (CAAX protease family)